MKTFEHNYSKNATSCLISLRWIMKEIPRPLFSRWDFFCVLISLYRFSTSQLRQNMSLRSDSEKQPARHLSTSAAQRGAKHNFIKTSLLR